MSSGHCVRMKRLVPALLPVGFLAACAVIPAATRSDGFAAIGQRTLVGGATVAPVSVIEDSRCPMNARCIWAGRVVVSATVSRGGMVERRQFTLGEPTDGIVLDSVEPGRMTDRQIKPAEYRLHFDVAP